MLNVMRQATRDITSWPYYDDGGYIGIWYVNAGSAYGDDFGGGSMPGASLLGVHVKASLVKVSREKAYQKAQTLQIPPSGQVWKSYYFVGSMRIAIRTQVNGAADQVYYLLSDHLGSTSITVDVNNSKQAELRYAPWGSTRYSWDETPTDNKYTGQREEAGIGLYFYQSRFYDANLGRFVSADTDVPESQDVQVLDRYVFVGNNPIKYTDQTGHCWGIASFLRGLPIYDVTCENLDMALTIVQDPDADLGEKALAGSYIAIEAVAHTALVVGTAGLACAVSGPGCVTAAEGMLGIGAGACKDGDCTNEIKTSYQIGREGSDLVYKILKSDPSLQREVRIYINEAGKRFNFFLLNWISLLMTQYMR